MEEKILIVEDESIIALDLQYGLKDLGYKVIGTADNVRMQLTWLQNIYLMLF